MKRRTRRFIRHDIRKSPRLILLGATLGALVGISIIALHGSNSVIEQNTHTVNLGTSEITSPQDVQPAMGVRVVQPADNTVQLTTLDKLLPMDDDGRILLPALDTYQVQGR